MFLSGKNVDELVNSMNIEMEKVTDWLNVNKLSLNLKKDSLYDFQREKDKIECK